MRVAAESRRDNSRRAHHGDRSEHRAASRGPPSATRPTRNPVEQFGRVDTIGLKRVQRASHALVVRVHLPASVTRGSGSKRSLANAFDVWLFTVPTEHPSASAVAASLRSS